MESMRYVDFNNNRYSVTQEKIRYQPITALESSSGTYAGGEPAEAVMTMEHFAEIVECVKAIVDDRAIQAAKRRMLTVMLTIEKNGERSNFIIRRSAKQKALQEALRKALKLK